MKNMLSEVMVKKSADFKDEAAIIEKIESGYLVDRGTQFRKKRSFSPSSLVWGNGECARYWFYAFSGADFSDDADAYAVANMSNGTLAHGRIQKAMLDGGFLLEDEVKLVNEDPPIFGFADGLAEWNGERVAVEIKTMREEAFEYRLQSRTAPTYHVEQLLYYMKIMKLSKGFLVYEGKGTHRLMILEVNIKDEYIEWVDNAFDWMRKVYKAWEEGQKPERNYRTNSKICKGCPVKEKCFSEGKEGDIKIEPLRHLPK